MADTADQNIDNNTDEELLTSSQPHSNKRSAPASPDDLPATRKQNSRQIRRRNSIGNLNDPELKKTAAARKNIQERVLEALNTPDVLNKIVPYLVEKISESISTVIESEIQACVDTHISPLVETVNANEKMIEDHKQKICQQSIKIRALETTVNDMQIAADEREREIDELYSKFSDLEVRVENQEQYSRRTSLRFHNVKVPTDEYDNIVFPVATDKYILDICNNQLGLNLTINDIGRSHVIGKPRFGKSQVIVRFISYRIRQLVFSNKKLLRDHPSRVFITENLTQFRTSLTKRLAQMRQQGDIHTYWTLDGRIYVKKHESGRKELIRNFDDIDRLERAGRSASSSTR